jgi:hypothetical protein
MREYASIVYFDEKTQASWFIPVSAEIKCPKTLPKSSSKKQTMYEDFRKDTISHLMVVKLN